MGDSDAKTRDFVRDPKVFADICNYFLFQGRQEIKPEMLSEKDPTELVLPFGDDQIVIPVQKYRDVLKSVSMKETEQATYFMVGIENQSEVHYAMAVRNMLYDAMNYASQVSKITSKNRKNKAYKNEKEFLSGLRKDDKIKPVITIMIYWGTEGWDAPRCLHEMFECREDMLKYVPDYNLNLIVPAEIKDFSAFQSDVSLVFQCLKCAGDKTLFQQLLKKDRERYSNLELRVASLISTLTNWKMNTASIEGGKVNMCKAIEDIKLEGKLEGKYILLVDMIKKKIQKGKSLEETADALEKEPEDLRELYQLVEANIEKSGEEIFQIFEG